MTGHYFGTDGIRGRVFDTKITPELALKVGLAAGKLLSRGAHKHKVIIGKDTRRSCYMLEASLGAGFSAAGMDVIYTGPMPTPAIAKLVTGLRCDAGVMISASHNPHYDNGMKFFGPDGYKIADDIEAAIEELLVSDEKLYANSPDAIGHVVRDDDVRGRYIEYVKTTIPDDISLEGLKVVLDCANGAAYRVAPMALRELGADVIALGVEPNGLNINDNCGSTYPQKMCATVIETGADLGIALDGDADRIIICDEKGQVVDGDQLMAVIARSWQRDNRLSGKGLVATVMSNMGLEDYITSLGLDFIRTPVGDRHVMKEMRGRGINVGGEQSGHIIFSDFATTGDGLMCGLQILAELVRSKEKASSLCARFTPYPQVLKNIRYADSDPLEELSVKEAISGAEQKLNGEGRVLIRKSGTEPVIRVMAEGKELKKVNLAVDDIIDSINSVL